MKRIHIGLIGAERDKQDGIVEKNKIAILDKNPYPSPENGEKSCPTLGLLEQIQDFRDMVTAS